MEPSSNPSLEAAGRLALERAAAIHDGLISWNDTLHPEGA
jgi:hypothetical protein